MSDVSPSLLPTMHQWCLALLPLGLFAASHAVGPIGEPLSFAIGASMAIGAVVQAYKDWPRQSEPPALYILIGVTLFVVCISLTLIWVADALVAQRALSVLFGLSIIIHVIMGVGLQWTTSIPADAHGGAARTWHISALSAGLRLCVNEAAIFWAGPWGWLVVNALSRLCLSESRMLYFAGARRKE